MGAALNEKVIAKEGKYLTFALGHEEYGLEILGVREIIKIMDITAVPKVAEYVKGVINLRGKVIPVIDLRLKFSMQKMDYTKETCIIVLNVLNSLMGIVVDKVCEVVDISQDNIEPAPSFGSKAEADFITGMGKIAGKVKILLNIDKVLQADANLSLDLASK